MRFDCSVGVIKPRAAPSLTALISPAIVAWIVNVTVLVEVLPRPSTAVITIECAPAVERVDVDDPGHDSRLAIQDHGRGRVVDVGRAVGQRDLLADVVERPVGWRGKGGGGDRFCRLNQVAIWARERQPRRFRARSAGRSQLDRRPAIALLKSVGLTPARSGPARHLPDPAAKTYPAGPGKPSPGRPDHEPRP